MTQCPLCKGEADGLTFNALRNANIARLPLFKNSKGEPAHSDPQRYQTHNEGDAMTDRPRPMYCEAPPEETGLPCRSTTTGGRDG